jgi:sec-independent protein translocase protein TatA
MQMPNLGTPELIIVLVIVLLVFGAGRLVQLGRGLGEGIHEFRAALVDGDEDSEEEKTGSVSA